MVTRSVPTVRGRHADPRAAVAGSSGPWRLVAPMIVLVVAAGARLWNLGIPKTLMFDETYYVKDAWTLWHLGYEGNWPQNPDVAWNAGQVNSYLKTAEFVAHPPLGKWIIGIGEMLTGGTNPAGWRVTTALVGVLAVALLMVIAHRLFQNALVTVVAGGLFAIDNQAITMSRIALLDNQVMFFALVAFACLIEDRFWVERRMGRWLWRTDGTATGWGPTFLWRPWLMGCAVALGLDSGVKWSGLYFFIAFIAYSVLTDLMLRRRVGIRGWPLATLVKQVPATALLTVPLALLTYIACFAGYILTTGGWDRLYIRDGGTRFTGLLAWVPDSLQGLWQWTEQIYQFHVGLDLPHPYMSPAILWPIIARPTSMYWLMSSAGQNGCPSGTCTSALNDIPNPLIWYAAIAATIYLVVRYVRRREWQAGAILIGVAGGYLPWLLYPNRTMFFFYSIAFEPYILLALAATIGLMLAHPVLPETADAIDLAEAERSRSVRVSTVIVFGVLAVLVSVFFFPLSSGLQTPYWFWHIHMWSTTWV